MPLAGHGAFLSFPSLPAEIIGGLCEVQGKAVVCKLEHLGHIGSLHEAVLCGERSFGFVGSLALHSQAFRMAHRYAPTASVVTRLSVPTGRMNLKVDPLFSPSLSAQISPSCNATISLEMVRPTPIPKVDGVF